MAVDFMRPAFNSEPEYSVTMLTRAKGTGAPSVVEGLVWFTDGHKMERGARAGVSVLEFFGPETALRVSR